MVNYSKGIIYKLCCNDPNIVDIYVGSTTNFSRRKSHHKTCCNNPNNKSYNYPVYQFIRKNGSFSNWSMVLIREYNTTNKKKLERKERQYIEKLGATLNCIIPTRNKKEHYEANKNQILAQVKMYREANKELIKQKIKQFREANVEHIREQRKEYYKDNKENINQRKKEKIECECGCMLRKSDMARHKKSQKHKDLMDNQ